LVSSAELGEVIEHPFVFEGVVDDGEELAGCGDDRLAGAAPFLDPEIEAPQIWRVSDRAQRALHQRRADETVAALGDAAAVVGFVGLADARDNADASREFVGVGKVADES
jgi:hypothetical protein